MVVTATRPKTFPGGEFGLPCVLDPAHAAEGERHDKLALNDILREHGAGYMTRARRSALRPTTSSA